MGRRRSHLLGLYSMQGPTLSKFGTICYSGVVSHCADPPPGSLNPNLKERAIVDSPWILLFGGPEEEHGKVFTSSLCAVTPSTSLSSSSEPSLVNVLWIMVFTRFGITTMLGNVTKTFLCSGRDSLKNRPMSADFVAKWSC